MDQPQDLIERALFPLVSVKGSCHRTGDPKVGTGYAIAADLVLTSGHVVPRSRDTCTVTTREGETYPAKVIWNGDVKTGPDAALLEVEGYPWGVDFTPAWSWGELPRQLSVVKVVTFGYPRLAVDKNGARKQNTSHWGISPSDGDGTTRYLLDLRQKGPKPELQQDGVLRPAWAGLSGAPVFTEDHEYLLGIVAATSGTHEATCIEAVRIRAILDSETFSDNARATVDDIRTATPAVDFVRTADEIFDVDAVPCPIDDIAPIFRSVERYRLDTLLATSAVGAQFVVGDVRLPSDLRRPLATALDSIEQAAAKHAGSAPRRWFGLTDDELQDAPTLDAVKERLMPPTSTWAGALREDHQGRHIGIVVPVELDTSALAPGHGQVVTRTVERLRTALPHAAIVVHVVAAIRFDVVRVASQLAHIGTPLVLRTAQLSNRLADIGGEGDALATAVARVREFADERGLSWSPPFVDGRVGDGLPDPVALVAALNVRKLPAADELSLMRAFRSALPQLHEEILNAHARGREGRNRYASLALASECPEDLTLWLHVGGHPDRTAIPISLFSSELTNAMLVELVRTNAGPGDFAAWCKGAGRARKLIGQHVRRVDERWRIDLAALAGVDGVDAGVLAHLAASMGRTVAELPSAAADRPFFWALLSRSPLTPETAAATARLPYPESAVLEACGDLAADLGTAKWTTTLRGQLPQWRARRNDNAG